MTNDLAVRLALQFAAFVTVVRRYVAEQGHEQGGCAKYPCLLCEALAAIDGPKP